MRIPRHNISITNNGAITLPTSYDPHVDLFFMIGASRGKDISEAFDLAYQEDPVLASKILLHARDIRGGSGERELFRNLALRISNPFLLDQIIRKIPDIGRIDDLWTFIDVRRDVVLEVIITEYMKGNALAAKWTPRKGPIFETIRKALNIKHPKEFRKMLVEMSSTVEQMMSASDWTSIDYSKLPSCALLKYTNAFKKRDHNRFDKFTNDLKNGDVKVNAGAVYPYNIIHSIENDPDVAQSMWNSLPNYMIDKDPNERVLPVIDVSGSMDSRIGSSCGISCKDVAVSLGLYIAERNTGFYKNKYISFSGDPHFHYVEDEWSLQHKIESIDASGEDCNTNLIGVFKTLLSYAVKNNVPESDMPTMLQIISDMEFDTAANMTRFSYFARTPNEHVGYDSENVEIIRKLYEQHGYRMPKLVFWNVNARHDNVPVRHDSIGTMMVSGFSTSILSSIMNCKEITSRGIMMEAVSKEKYSLMI